MIINNGKNSYAAFEQCSVCGKKDPVYVNDTVLILPSGKRLNIYEENLLGECLSSKYPYERHEIFFPTLNKSSIVRDVHICKAWQLGCQIKQPEVVVIQKKLDF